MGDTGAAFVALPQIPPRNANLKTGSAEPVYEKIVLKALGIERLETTK
jgi:sulfide:quinone oxidoreductase